MRGGETESPPDGGSTTLMGLNALLAPLCDGGANHEKKKSRRLRGGMVSLDAETIASVRAAALALAEAPTDDSRVSPGEGQRCHAYARRAALELLNALPDEIDENDESIDELEGDAGTLGFLWNCSRACRSVLETSSSSGDRSVPPSLVKAIDAAVVGISVDDVESHKAFSDKYKLPFTILADSDNKTASDYGVLRYYKLLKLASRQSFLVDPDGKIAKHYDDVDPDKHTNEVLEDIKTLSETWESTL